MAHDKYIFKSERLGFRDWLAEDVREMVAINCDPAVMEFFPDIQPEKQTVTLIEKMKKQLAEKGFCYFAVDKLENNEFIGFIGLSEQTFEAHFTPCVDIGWRLKKTAWNNGFATEGAKRCLEYGFDYLDLDKIVAVAPKLNLRSERVMKKIGMKKTGSFKHPLLAKAKRLENCLLYEIVNVARSESKG